jgi:hypothetical protein
VTKGRAKGFEAKLHYQITKFDTGTCKYSMMNAITKRPVSPTILIPSDRPSRLSNTAAIGFIPLDLKDDEYMVRIKPHFETEGDREFSLEKPFLEAKVWTRIRIDPTSLSLGDMVIIPGTAVARFEHQRLEVEDTGLHLARFRRISWVMIDYNTKNIGQTVVVRFSKDFPSVKISSEETYGRGTSNVDTSLMRTLPEKNVAVDYSN